MNWLFKNKNWQVNQCQQPKIKPESLDANSKDSKRDRTDLANQPRKLFQPDFCHLI